MSWSRRTLYGVLGLLFLLHNDVWNWDDASLVFGFPVGLFYHVVFCLACAAVMGLLSYYAWPRVGTKERPRSR